MAGTLSVYHWPVRPMKKNYTFKKKQRKGNARSKYKVLMLKSSHTHKITVK